MTVLTPRQRDVLDYIKDYIEVWEKPPAIREIQAYFGFRSPSTVAVHLAALERKGFIRRTKHESRNIKLWNNCSI